MAVAVLLPTRVRLSSRRLVLLVAGAVVVFRVPLVGGSLHTDEAGYFLVAQGWRAGGPNLYGHYFVDRPPLLIALYRVAVLTGWPSSIRLLATGFAVVLVLSAACAARQVAGARGAVAAALVAGALATTPLLNTQEADGEIFAAPLVMLSVALTLTAVRRSGVRSSVAATAAGVSAAAAVMVKQNFADGVVFALVLLLAVVAQRRASWCESARIGAGVVAGSGLILVGALGYVVWSRVGLATAYTAVFGLRSTALDVIEDHSLHSVIARAVVLVVLAVLTGAVPLMGVLVAGAARRRLRGSPVAWAVGVTLAFDVVSISLGGSYWSHYLIQLAPMLALGAGLGVADAGRVRAVVAVMVATTVAATSVVVLSGFTSQHQGQVVGDWLRTSAHPGDTATMLFGNAETQLTSGMVSPYQQLWTLPMRTLDPRLSTLRAVLSGPRAPTWIVLGHSLDPWNIDAHGQTRRTLAEHYRVVARVCGRRVLLHDGVLRSLPPTTCG